MVIILISQSRLVMLTKKERCNKLLLLLLKSVGGGIETQSKVMVAAKWWLFLQLQK